MGTRTFINKNGVRARIEYKFGWYYMSFGRVGVYQSESIEPFMKILKYNDYVEIPCKLYY